MKILVLTKSCFFDSSLPLYKAFSEKRGMMADCLIHLDSLNSPLFSIKSRYWYPGVIKSSNYTEFDVYKKYADFNHVYIFNNAFSCFRCITSLLGIVSLLLFVFKGKYDIIQCDFAFRGWMNCLYIFRKKIVRIQHDPLPHSGENWTGTTNKVLRRAQKYIEKIVILNRTQYDEYLKLNHLSPKRVLVNQLGIYDYLSELDTSNIVEEQNCVLYFGRLSKYKGLENFCSAMKIAHEYNPNLSVIIAGSGEFDFDITEYNNLPYFTIINKFLSTSELVKLIKKASIVSCVYSDATQSGVILSCFGLFKPVIASDIDTMREIIDNEKSGVLVPPSNPQVLSDTVLSLLKDQTQLIKMSEYIKETYMTGERSWNAIADRYLAFYNR